MTAPARFRQADIARALKAAKSCGFEEVRVRIDVSGQLEVIVGKAANDQPHANTIDGLLGDDP